MTAVMAVLAIGAFAFSSALENSPHVLTGKFDHRIVYGTKVSPNCQLYFLPNGPLLIDLRPMGDALYVVNPTTNEIEMPNESNFYFGLGHVYSKALTPPSVSMNHSIGKIDVDHNLLVQEYGVEFTSAKNTRVTVNWWLNK